MDCLQFILYNSRDVLLDTNGVGLMSLELHLFKSIWMCYFIHSYRVFEFNTNFNNTEQRAKILLLNLSKKKDFLFVCLFVHLSLPLCILDILNCH